MSTLNVANVTDGTTSVPTGYVVNGSAKAWVSSVVTSGTPAVTESINVSSVVDRAAGVFDYNLTSAMDNANFALAITTQYTTAAGSGAFFCQDNGGQRTTSRFGLDHFQNGTNADPIRANGQAFGDLA